MTPADGYEAPDPLNNANTIEELIGKLGTEPGAADLLIALVNRQMVHARQRTAPRVLSAGADVYRNAANTALWYPGGPSRFEIFNFSTGLKAAISSKDNLNQVDITANGAGADCMFSVIVSSCFSSLAGWTEGDTYYALSGCSFRTSLTPQLAADYIRDTYSNAGAVFICKGSYDGGMHIHHSNQIQVVGAGRELTVIKGANPQAEVVNGYVVDAGTSGQTAAIVGIRDLTIDGTIGTGTPSVAVFGNQNACTVTLTNVQLNVPASGNGAQFNGNETISGLRIIGPSSGTQATSGCTSANNTTDPHQAEKIYISGCDRGMKFTNAANWDINQLYVTGANAARGDANGAGALCFHTGPGLNNSRITNVEIVNSVVALGFTNDSGINNVLMSVTIKNCARALDLRGTTTGIVGWIFDDFKCVLGTAGDIGIDWSAADSTPGTKYSQFTNFNFTGYASGNEIISVANIGTGTVGYHNISDAGTVADFGSPYGHAAAAAAAPSPHNLVSVHHDGEQDYTNLLSLLGLDVSTGDIDMYSDAGITRTGNWDGPTGHIGIGQIAAAGSALAINKSLGVSSARGINVVFATTVSTGAAAGLLFGATQNATSGTTASFGGSTGSGEHGGLGVTITDLYAYRGLLDSVAGTGAITRAQGFWLPAASWGAGVIPVTTHVLLAEDQGNASTTTAYGLKIAAQTGTAKRSFIADGLALGTDAALKGLLDVYGHVAVLTDNAVRLYDSDNSNYIGLRADSARSTDITYVLPATDPTASQVLSASAPSAGVVTLTWVTPTAFPRQWVWAPDAAPAAVIVSTADAQGNIYHSGPGGFTAVTLYVDAETAPGASGLPITVSYGDTNDLDTVASWTTIATYTLSSEKSNKTTSMTNAAVPANRLMRMTVGTIVGSPADATITLEGTIP